LNQVFKRSTVAAFRFDLAHGAAGFAAALCDNGCRSHRRLTRDIVAALSIQVNAAESASRGSAAVPDVTFALLAARRPAQSI
jgi:hypothetical protein